MRSDLALGGDLRERHSSDELRCRCERERLKQRDTRRDNSSAVCARRLPRARHEALRSHEVGDG